MVCLFHESGRKLTQMNVVNKGRIGYLSSLISQWLKSFFKNLSFCQGNTFRNMPLKREKKKPQFLLLSLVSTQKRQYKLLYWEQLKFRNVTVIYDIHTIKIHEDSAMQKLILNLALRSHKHWCLEITKWLTRGNVVFWEFWRIL